MWHGGLNGVWIYLSLWFEIMGSSVDILTLQTPQYAISNMQYPYRKPDIFEHITNPRLACTCSVYLPQRYHPQKEEPEEWGRKVGPSHHLHNAIIQECALRVACGIETSVIINVQNHTPIAQHMQPCDPRDVSFDCQILTYGGNLVLMSSSVFPGMCHGHILHSSGPNCIGIA